MDNSKFPSENDANEIVISAIDVAEYDASTIPDDAIVMINKNTLDELGNVMGHASNTYDKATFIEAVQPQYIERKLKGHYRLIEAALYLERHENLFSYHMLERLICAVTDLSLKAFIAKNGKRHTYTSGKVRADKQEVSWKRLNEWLMSNEDGISKGFPDPALSSLSSVCEELSKTKELPWWQVDYDILVMAQANGTAISRKGEKPSARKVADAVSLDLERKEKGGGKRETPTGDTIRNTVLKGWKFTPD